MKNLPAAVRRLGRKLAEEYLEHKGYAVLARNIRTPYGEIDLLVRQEATLVFVEVKAVQRERMACLKTA